MDQCGGSLLPKIPGIYQTHLVSSYSYYYTCLYRLISGFSRNGADVLPWRIRTLHTNAIYNTVLKKLYTSPQISSSVWPRTQQWIAKSVPRVSRCLYLQGRRGTLSGLKPNIGSLFDSWGGGSRGKTLVQIGEGVGCRKSLGTTALQGRYLCP